MANPENQGGNGGNGDEEPPASMAHVKQVIRRTLRKTPPHEENFLNIYPMMDIMVILLVFMVMQFAASSVSNIQQNDALQIPYSTSQMEPKDAMPLQVSRNEVAVDGEHVVSLRNGKVDPSQKQGGSKGFLITPLHEELKERAEMAKRIARQNNRQFKGKAQIIADKRTPYRTISEVVYTLGQVGYKNIRFVVNKKTRE